MENIFGLIKSKLTSSDARPISNMVLQDEHRRIAHFRRLYDFYVYNREHILKYVVEAMKPTFKTNTISKMQFPMYNLTRKIIDQLAVAYLLPAKRYVVVKSASKVDGGETITVKDTRDEKDNEIYQEILTNSNINAASKAWNRMAKLLTTVYVGVVFRDGRIEFEIYPPHGISITEDPKNYLEPIAVRYEQAFGGETYEIEWTAETYTVRDKEGRLAEGYNDWGGVNKYGVVPFLPCRLSVPDDHWGEGDSELVSMNEKLNILLASMFYNALMQSHGQAFGVNLGLDKIRPQDGNEAPEVATGPGYVIEVNNVRKDDVLPSLTYLHPDPATAENMATADWLIKTAAVMKGLSANSVSINVSDQSGVAKTLDMAELAERRQDDIEFLRPFEKRLFDLVRIVWNANSTDKISDAAVFGIDFEEPEPTLSVTEEQAKKQWEMSVGLYTPVDDMIDEDEGIDEQQALAYILRNIKLNNEIKKASADAQAL